MPKTLSVTVVSLALIFCLFSLSFCEDITITTYYPSPYGSYNELTTADNTYLAASAGSVGIGTKTPGAKLDVEGNVKIADGTEGAGKVLTSDANGLASWQGYWVVSGNDIYNTNSDNVGIGTMSPGAKLEVVEPGASALRLRKAAGSAGSVDIFVAVGDATDRTGAGLCSNVVSTAACLAFWRSDGTNINCAGNAEAFARALCADFGD